MSSSESNIDGLSSTSYLVDDVPVERGTITEISGVVLLIFFTVIFLDLNNEIDSSHLVSGMITRLSFSPRGMILHGMSWRRSLGGNAAFIVSGFAETSSLISLEVCWRETIIGGFDQAPN